jgi:hypothetical protein
MRMVMVSLTVDYVVKCSATVILVADQDQVGEDFVGCLTLFTNCPTELFLGWFLGEPCEGVS